MRKKLDLPEKEICDIYRSGKSLLKIGVIYNCSESTIRKVLKRNDVKTRGKSGTQINLPVAEIVKLYTDGKSTYDIANIYGVSNATIGNRLRKMGIEIRSLVDAGLLYHQQHPEIGIEHGQWMKGDSKEVRLMREKRTQWIIDHPEELKLQGEISSQWFKDHPEDVKLRSEKHVQWVKDHPEVMASRSEKRVQWNKDHPEEIKLQGENFSQWCKDHPEEIKLQGENFSRWCKDHPEEMLLRDQKHSATHQDQDFDAGEWTGFLDGDRSHVLPISKCIQLNERSEGSEGHHITKSIVVFIPADLHNHIWHNLKSGNGMAEINMIALQYINGCYGG